VGGLPPRKSRPNNSATITSAITVNSLKSKTKVICSMLHAIMSSILGTSVLRTLLRKLAIETKRVPLPGSSWKVTTRDLGQDRLVCNWWHGLPTAPHRKGEVYQWLI
jgi:hypothetical protein